VKCEEFFSKEKVNGGRSLSIILTVFLNFG